MNKEASQITQNKIEKKRLCHPHNLQCHENNLRGTTVFSLLQKIFLVSGSEGYGLVYYNNEVYRKTKGPLLWTWQ